MEIAGIAGDMDIVFSGNTIDLDMDLTIGNALLDSIDCGDIDNLVNLDIMDFWALPDGMDFALTSYADPNDPQLLPNFCNGLTYDPNYACKLEGCNLETFDVTTATEDDWAAHLAGVENSCSSGITSKCLTMGQSSARYDGPAAVDPTTWNPFFTQYTCTTEEYESNPWVCMAGDISGKLGSLALDTSFLQVTYVDNFPIPPQLLHNKGVRVYIIFFNSYLIWHTYELLTS